MAYTIRLTGPRRRYDVKRAIKAAIKRDKRFTADVISMAPKPEVHLQNVRRTASRDYCGQHPGLCNPFGRGHYQAKLLEWEDWRALHGIVNDVLDKLGIEADVWSKPRERMAPGKSRYWIRKNNKRRVRFDYEQVINRLGVPIQTWNSGTDDQFITEAQPTAAAA